MTSTQEQREQIIIGLALVEQKVDDLCILVRTQNGNITENAKEIVKNGKHISRIIGIGIGIVCVFSIAIGLVKFL